jgi:transcriptional regulator with XRE-family HTH domain/biotin operon repressor
MLIGRVSEDLEEDVASDGAIDEEGVDGGRPGPGSPAAVRLGSNARDLRADAGLTLEALATATTGGGGTPATSWLSQVETGKAQIGVLRTLRLAAATGGSIDRLLEGIYWNPGEVARVPRERRPPAERMGGYFTVLPPGEAAFEEPAEVVEAGRREEVAGVIAANVMDGRSRRHLRQRDFGLADGAGAYLIEAGEREPELAALLTIARALELPPDFLLRGIQWRPPPGPAPVPRLRALRHDALAKDEAVTRLWLDDLTASAIADELGITQPSVEGIVRRLRARGVYLPSRTAGRRPAGGPLGGEATEIEPATASPTGDGALHSHIAGNLRRHRTAAGLSLEQLAEAAESSLSPLRRAEVSGYELKLTTVVRVAACLKIPVTTLLAGISWSPPQERLVLEVPGKEHGAAGDIGPRLGGNIRAIRRRHRLSQEDVAARAGTQRRHLSTIETGRSLPRPITLLAIAHGIESELAEIFAGAYDWYVRPLPPPEYPNGEGPPSKADRQATMLRLWEEDASLRTIAEALDMTPSAVSGRIGELRAIGVDVPYRRPPEDAAALAARLGRRRRGRRWP